mgnify:CR=1 FL=1
MLYETLTVDEFIKTVSKEEIWDKLNIDKTDMLDIRIEEGHMIVQKSIPTCILCGATENVLIKNYKRVCANCIREIADGNYQKIYPEIIK